MQNEPAGPVCVTWRVKNGLGQLPIPCLFKYTEVLLYYSFLILNFTIQFTWCTSGFKTLEPRRYR